MHDTSLNEDENFDEWDSPNLQIKQPFLTQRETRDIRKWVLILALPAIVSGVGLAVILDQPTYREKQNPTWNSTNISQPPLLPRSILPPVSVTPWQSPIPSSDLSESPERLPTSGRNITETTTDLPQTTNGSNATSPSSETNSEMPSGTSRTSQGNSGLTSIPSPQIILTSSDQGQSVGLLGAPGTIASR
jgi:hypothetical protein